ncbi:hypothetical protein KL953_09865 [Mycolicibacterium goodii]|uniref:hypothetical protein n=1 Tax=Mycolicibacterium goodii TaxID=134601 RepID=UPI001BDD6E19|nr:hypothetical protein [Mycolicibacterium goodii]MBU8809200.1 hypothetical protein [Mycolicibacterium goodii]
MSEDIAEILTKAWKAVQDAGIPEPLHELALGRAIDFLAGGSAPRLNGQQTGSQDVGQQSDSTGSAGGGGTASGPSTSEDDFYEKMSKGTGVSKTLLERLVHIHENAPHIWHVPRE